MTATKSKSQGTENCVVGGEKKKKKMAMCCTRVKHGKKDWLKIKHIALFCYLNPKKSVVEQCTMPTIST